MIQTLYQALQTIFFTVRQFWKLGAAVREPGARTKALLR